jgi:hypothetical protein
MSELLIYNQKIESVFQLLGEKENDISFSVGWALSKAPEFLDVFLKSTIACKEKHSAEDIKIKLQRYEEKRGFTDFEIERTGYFHLIIEAKRGWNFPSKAQLEKYAKRKSFNNSNAKIKKIIVVSEASQEYAKANFDIKQVEGIEVIFISWKDIYNYSRQAIKQSSHAEKRLLKELNNYLETIMTMKKNDSNWAYVVALGNGTPKGSKISHIDVVEKKLRYWHPLGGNGWPTEPPNYLAFRYGGKLQSIHHVDSYEVFTNPHTILKEMPNVDWGEPCFAYHLSKGFKPVNEVKTGKLYANGRVWAMLDTLFICKTIAQARDLSKVRLNVE